MYVYVYVKEKTIECQQNQNLKTLCGLIGVFNPKL